MQSEIDPNHINSETVFATKISASAREAIVRDAYQPDGPRDIVLVKQNAGDADATRHDHDAARHSGDTTQKANEMSAVIADVRKGASWSERSTIWFRRQFDEAAHKPGATEESIFQALSNITDALNQLTPKPQVGLVDVQDDHGKWYFFVTIQKDQETQSVNEDAAMQLLELNTAKWLGIFRPTI